jgi:hypothetical protein
VRGIVTRSDSCALDESLQEHLELGVLIGVSGVEPVFKLLHEAWCCAKRCEFRVLASSDGLEGKGL